MALFRYRALSASGKTTTHVVDADSLSSAKERLRREQVLVLEVVPLQRKERGLAPSLLLAFTRELAQLLKAGLPLYESLLTIEEKYRRHHSHSLFLDLCDHLKGGASLSSVLKKYPKTFSPIYLSMIQAGEQSGNLPFVVERLFELLFKQQKWKKDLFAATAYPCFLALFCFCITGVLFFFIIPSMAGLFEGRELHPLTYCVLAISRWLTGNSTLLLFLLITLPLIGFWSWRRGGLRKKLEAMSLKIPLLQTLVLDGNIMRLGRVLSVLIEGGVPLVEALQLSSQMLRNVSLQEAVDFAINGIMQGQRLSSLWKDRPPIPPLVVRMLATAEETGRMGEAFHNLSELYSNEMERSFSHLTTFLQPALLILLGGIVGLVVLSILLPLTDVSSFLNQ